MWPLSLLDRVYVAYSCLVMQLRSAREFMAKEQSADVDKTLPTVIRLP